MLMPLYPVFLFVASATVLTPGPGVVMTLTNALRYGFKNTFGGVLGLAFGALVLATLSATSLGVLLAASGLAFTLLKSLGAGYLIYLGIKLWRAPALSLDSGEAHAASFGRRFREGLSLQLTNPKSIFFFLSVLPQFIARSQPFGLQFSILVLSYGALLVLIHSLYILFAQRARGWLCSGRGARFVNRLGSCTFVIFGAALATARR